MDSAGTTSPMAAQSNATTALWTVKDVARFLARSERWVFRQLKRPETEPGSIPHYRLVDGAPRFSPQEIEDWVKAGCPPAATLRSWKGKAD